MTGARGAVFIAEDDPPMRTLLELAVRRTGHRVVGCGTGEQLFEHLRAAFAAGLPPALVVSDNRMPGLDGIEIAELVCGEGWHVPFVLLTAFPDQELLDRASRWSIAAVLSKPVSVACLMDTVRRHATAVGVLACPCCGEALDATSCFMCVPTTRDRLDPFDGEDPYVDLGGSD